MEKKYYTIEIDSETYKFLQKNAIAFEETPSEVVKRLLLDGKVSKRHIEKLSVTRTGKNRKVNLPELIRAGFLSEGEIVYFRDYKKNIYNDLKASIYRGQLLWEDTNYSMSKLASIFINKLFNEDDIFRYLQGPAFWVNSNDKSILDLWKEYLEKKI